VIGAALSIVSPRAADGDREPNRVAGDDVGGEFAAE
jgi:hypothetical protein